jgi:hypothetical protein
MRYTLQAWWCGGCKARNEPWAKECVNCGSPRIARNVQVHSSEKAVVFWNPSTGERRVPARADQPIPEVYRAQGFERREIESMIQYERQTGTVHEASNFLPGNEPGEPEPVRHSASPEIKRELIDEFRAMVASGPVTLAERPDSPPSN